MPTYIYKAAQRNGQIVRNRVEEANKYALLKRLKENKLIPITITQVNTGRKKVNKQKKHVADSEAVLRTVKRQEILDRGNKSKVSFKMKDSIFASKKITKRDIVIFTQNLFLLKKANFNNIHALSTIIDGTDNPSLRAVIEDILAGAEAGENMYTTMEYYDNIFPPIYVNIIKVGETSGSLTKALGQAVKYLDDTQAMNKRIKGILLPNLIQFGAMFLLLIVGSIVAIPAIQGVFDQMGSTEQLPGITIWFSNFLNAVVKIWYVPVGIILATGVGIFLYIQTPQGKYNKDYFKYKMPIFGKLIYAIEFQRLAKAILLNVNNGMRIQEALESSKNVSHNLVMLSTVETAINNILIGQSWIEPFEQSGLSSTMITEMLKIGMQTDLGEMMEKLVDYMETDINNIIEKIMKTLPQVFYLITGTMLIFVTLVVLVPCIQVYMGGWMFSAAGV